MRIRLIVLCTVIIAPLLAYPRPVRFTPPSPVPDCRVQVTDSASSVVQTIDCGAVADLATGSYAAWVTYGNAISARPTPLAIDAGSTVVEVALPAPTIPAGTVFLQAASGEVLDVLHLAPRIRDEDGPGWFFRVRPASGAAIVMPEGPAIAIGRERGGAPRWVSDPINVRAGIRNVIGPRRRGDGATLLAEVRVAPGIDAHDAGEGTMTLGGRKPHAWGTAADGILAVWYDLPPEPSVFAALADTWFVPAQQAALRSSETSWIRIDAQPRPTLTVFVETDRAEDITDPLVITVRADAQENPMETAVKVGLNELRHVPPGKLEISLAMGKWKFREEVDMSDGISRSVTFPLKPAIVTGTVSYRGKAARATVAFNGAEAYEVSTDESGEFRIALWRLARYGVAVKLTDRPEAPLFNDTVRITGDRELSITIPATAVRVRVVNTRTGNPIPDAFVMVKNTWIDQVEGSRGVMMRIPTDKKGEAALPPLRVGTIEVLAEAPGFAAGNPTKYTISGDDHAETIVIGLAEGAVQLTVALFDGRPAAGAVAVGYVSGRNVWTATSDSEGGIVVPDGFDGRIAVRHPAAGGMIGEWPLGTASAHWQLQPAAPPLRLRVVDRGGEPVPGARIIVWSGGTRIDGNALMFLYNAQPYTSSDGTWDARGLAAPEVRILAMRGRQLEPQMTLATLLRSPWPTLPAIQVLD